MSRDIKYIGMDVHKEAIVIAVLNGTARKIAAITLTLWKKEERFDVEQLKTQAA